MSDLRSLPPQDGLALATAEPLVIGDIRTLIADLRAENDRDSPYDHGIQYTLRRLEDVLNGKDYTQRAKRPPLGDAA